MNKLLLILLSTLALACAQRGVFGGGQQGLSGRQAGRSSGVAEQLAKKTSLDAGDRALHAKEARLARKAAKKKRLEAKAQRAAKREARVRKGNSENIASGSSVQFETVKDGAAFHEFDAGARRDTGNDLGVQLTEHNRDSELAKVSSSKGQKHNSGTRLDSADQLQASLFNQFEHDVGEESFGGETIAADEGVEEILNAADGFSVLGESSIRAQDMAQLQSEIFENAGFGEQGGVRQEGVQNTGFGRFGFNGR